MLEDKIIKILSAHRQPHRPELPLPLTVNALTTLLQQSVSPQDPAEHIRAQTQSTLENLEAEGEISTGLGKKVCMAPPTLLAESQTSTVGLLFQGDRAYLSMAHRVLETGQPPIKTTLQPRVNGFHTIKARLGDRGIRTLTLQDSVDRLPLPARPPAWVLIDNQYPANPFEAERWGSVRRYTPKSCESQSERWIEALQPTAGTALLRLAAGEFLWQEESQFYELSPELACLAMFHLDAAADCPLLVPWDDEPGRVQLQGTQLPGSYAQFLWRLSQPVIEMPRARRFEPRNRLLAQAALQRLGCHLV